MAWGHGAVGGASSSAVGDAGAVQVAQRGEQLVHPALHGAHGARWPWRVLPVDECCTAGLDTRRLSRFPKFLLGQMFPFSTWAVYVDAKFVFTKSPRDMIRAEVPGLASEGAARGKLHRDGAPDIAARPRNKGGLARQRTVFNGHVLHFPSLTVRKFGSCARPASAHRKSGCGATERIAVMDSPPRPENAHVPTNCQHNEYC